VTRFFFRLDRILWLRSHLEKEGARALGRARREEDARRLELSEAAARLARCGDQIAASTNGLALAGTMQILGLTVEKAAGHLDEACSSHQEAEEAVRQQEDRYREARKDRRVLERLRERRRDQWELENSRREQREIDSQVRDGMIKRNPR
jgi:flagellar FliJ protein